METPDRINFEEKIKILNEEINSLKNIKALLEKIKIFTDKGNSDLTESEIIELTKHKDELLKEALSLEIINVNKDILAKTQYISNFNVFYNLYIQDKNKRLLDFLKNGQKYIRIAKEFRNKQTIPPNTKRVLKELINKDIDKMNDDQKVDWQTKITDQITICDKMLYNG
jgi:hypothetical protein